MNNKARTHSTGGLSLKDKSANDDSEGYPTDEEWKLMEDKDKLAYLHDCLLELYLNIKFQGFDKTKITIDSERVDQELDRLKTTTSISLFEFIKTSIEIIIEMKAEANEEKVQEIVSQHLHELSNKGEYDLSLNAKEYEKYIQKLESEVRNHISVEQQMKLYIEGYQSKLEELEPIEAENNTLNSQLSKIKELNWKLDEDLKNLKLKNGGNKEKEMMAVINQNQFKQHSLEERVKDLEIIL